MNEGLLISQGSGLSAFLPINIIDDRIVEATESFSLTLTSDSSLIDFVMPNTTIFINDDEMRTFCGLNIQVCIMHMCVYMSTSML